MHNFSTTTSGSLSLAFVKVDPTLISKQQLFARIVGGFGGRAAEEVIFGEPEVTTGTVQLVICKDHWFGKTTGMAASFKRSVRSAPLKPGVRIDITSRDRAPILSRYARHFLLLLRLCFPKVLFDFPMKKGAQLNCFGHAYNQDNLWKEVKGEQAPVVATDGVTAKKLLMLSVVLKNYEVDWALVVGFGFLVTELLRSKGVKLKEGVATHRNAYLLQTKLHEPKGKGVTLKKKVVVEESSSNVPLTNVVKTANAKCKLDVEGKNQSKTVPKVPMVSLQSKANSKAIEKSEKSKKKAAKKSPTEVECTILSLQKAGSKDRRTEPVNRQTKLATMDEDYLGRGGGHHG
nr:uncharacterized protein LOC109167327 [Ipomoea trifida]